MAKRELVVMFRQKGDNEQISNIRDEEIRDKYQNGKHRDDLNELDFIKIGDEQNKHKSGVFGP